MSDLENIVYYRDDLDRILDMANDYKNGYSVDDNFNLVVSTLTSYRDLMNLMISDEETRNNYDFDGWWELNVFNTLEELRDYFEF